MEGLDKEESPEQTNEGCIEVLAEYGESEERFGKKVPSPVV
jgi:hypothetical protein